MIVKSITIFPVKSLDGMNVDRATLTTGGGFENDREFALFDERGKTINGKRFPRIQQIRTAYDLANREITLSPEGQTVRFHLDRDRSQMEEWFGDFLGVQVQIKQNAEGGFPDDSERPGPTLASHESYEEVVSWFPHIDPATIINRFRMNIELQGGGKPFWEDQLFKKDMSGCRFSIGEVILRGIKPCARCPVPTRDPLTGEGYSGFQKEFMHFRKSTLPEFVSLEQFPHFYMFGVNTNTEENLKGKEIRVGDALTLL
ncbi:MOSC N-terminal beta barrel domain-containing protein [Rapidithrix thailandica]|uniref:MOSC N-terminal beta barrel domain-containing protein n=1 Tax=Rapidithrix thailandica TaxID=413964 RepID=A0AAW9SG09_9BACT